MCVLKIHMLIKLPLNKTLEIPLNKKLNKKYKSDLYLLLIKLTTSDFYFTIVQHC